MPQFNSSLQLFFSLSLLLTSIFPWEKACADTKINCETEELNKTAKKIIEIDQSDRKKYIDLKTDGNPETVEKKEKLLVLATSVTRIDKMMEDQIDEIVTQCGWPTGPFSFNSLIDATWLVTMHAPLTFQEKYFPLLKASHIRGELPDNLMQLLEERYKNTKAFDQNTRTNGKK